jgi:ligand-binding sensor domain-containing protein
MINLITNKDNGLKNQIEFLLGKEVPLTTSEINSLAHLTTGNLWVVKVLEKLNLSIDDIIYENDRENLRQEVAKTNFVHSKNRR